VGSTITFSGRAAGTSPLSYQWRLNGTNVPLATTSALSFVVQSNNAGIYSLVVSNLYGTTTSLSASFNPTLRFLVPSISGGTFSLILVNSDGTPVATNRAARVSVYASTNLALPLANWTPLTNAVVPSAGQLRIDGLTVASGPGLFFRAAEAP
jgi:hypothetical protein